MCDLEIGAELFVFDNAFSDAAFCWQNIGLCGLAQEKGYFLTIGFIVNDVMAGACRNVWFAVFLVQAFLNGANVYGQLETEAMLQVIYSRGVFCRFYNLQ